MDVLGVSVCVCREGGWGKGDGRSGKFVAYITTVVSFLLDSPASQRFKLPRLHHLPAPLASTWEVGSCSFRWPLIRCWALLMAWPPPPPPNRYHGHQTDGISVYRRKREESRLTSSFFTSSPFLFSLSLSPSFSLSLYIALVSFCLSTKMLKLTRKNKGGETSSTFAPGL